MEKWMLEATEIPAIEADVCFLLSEEFYYGADTQEDVLENKKVVPLTLPAFPRQVEQMVRSKEAMGNEDALATYYEQVIALGKQHQKSFNQCRQCFWMRLWIWSEEPYARVSFPWYDTLSEINHLIDELTSKISGEVYFDTDQGWEIKIIAEDGFLYIREGDPDDKDEQSLIKVPRDALITQLTEARDRSRSIVTHLSSRVGGDLWTNHHPSFDWLASMYAGFWIRTGAAIIDSIFVMAIIVPILTWIYGVTYWQGESLVHGFWDVVLNYLAPAMAVVAFWIYKSATPGKMMTKITIVDAETGEQPSTRQFIVRYLGYYVSMIPLFLGMIWVGLDKRKQGWHDKLAGTVVVKTDAIPKI